MGHYDQDYEYEEQKQRASKKKSTKKKVAKKIPVNIPGNALREEMRSAARGGPKAGDTVSMAFHYAGLVSWEEAELGKVAKGKEVVWIDTQLYEKKDNGTYVYEDNTVGPCKKVLHLDGGERAKKYAEENV